MKMYEIPENYRAWERAVVEAGDEVTEELAAAFDFLQATLVDKADAIGWLVREAEADEEAFRATARAFQAKAQAAANRAASLKAYMTRVLRAMGLDGVKSRHYTFSIARAGRPTIRWDHGREIPAGFAKVETRLDGEAAQQAYRSGTLPAGFEVSFTESLRIR